MAALIFTVLVWGVTSVFVRSFSVEVGPLKALPIRLVLVALVFLLVMIFKTGFNIAWQDWPRMLLISFIGVLGYFLGTVYGFAYAPAGLGSLIMSTQPLIIAVLASLAGTEKLRPMTVLGLIISFAGSILLVWGDDIGTATTSTRDVIFGCGLIFIGGAAWSVYVVFSKPLIQSYGALKVTAISNSIIALPLLPLLGADTLPTLQGLSPQGWGAIIFLTFLGASFSVVTWNYAAGIVKPSLLGGALYIVPLLAVVAGWAMLGETITLHIIIAGLIILLGVAVSQFNLPDIKQLKGLGLVVFAVCMWGMVPVGMRFLLLDLTPQTAMALRLIPAGLVAAVIAVWLGAPRITMGDWIRLIAAALLGNLAYQVLAAFGIKLIPASWTGMLFGLEPIFIALGAFLFTGESISRWFIVGLLVALSGTGVLVYGGSTGTVLNVSVFGIILITLSTFGWAIYTTLIRPISARYGGMLTACLVLAITALPITGLINPTVIAEVSKLTPTQWMVTAFLSLFATVLAVGAWNMALDHMDSSRAGMFLYMQPLIAAIGSIWLLGESLSTWLIAGGTLIFTGVAISHVQAKPVENGLLS